MPNPRWIYVYNCFKTPASLLAYLMSMITMMAFILWFKWCLFKISALTSPVSKKNHQSAEKVHIIKIKETKIKGRMEKLPPPSGEKLP